jgi:hypothetical protein
MKRLLLGLLATAVLTLPLCAATVDGLRIHSSTAGNAKRTV